jgi:hypothetical protein
MEGYKRKAKTRLYNHSSKLSFITQHQISHPTTRAFENCKITQQQKQQQKQQQQK